MRIEKPVQKWLLASAGILVAMYLVAGVGIDLLAPHLLAHDTRTASGEKIVLTKLGKVFYPAILLTETVRSLMALPSRLDKVRDQQCAVSQLATDSKTGGYTAKKVGYFIESRRDCSRRLERSFAPNISPQEKPY